jgi:DNA-binding NarL/FixJ family response regulator
VTLCPFRGSGNLSILKADAAHETDVRNVPAHRIRVLIVDDHPVVADSLSRLLDEVDDMQVLGIATSAEESIRMTRAEVADVVLMDLVLPDGSGAEAALTILRENPLIKVLFLSAHHGGEALLNALEAGGSGHIFKGAGGAAVIDGIRRVASGETLVAPEVLSALAARRRQKDELRGERTRILATLTSKEHEVLVRLSQGLTTMAISDELGIGVATVRSYVQRIIEKLGAHSKLEAVARAKDLGLLSRD